MTGVRAGYRETEFGTLPDDWQSVTVETAAARTQNAVVGGPFGSDLVSSDYAETGVPIIRGQNMGGKFVDGTFAFVSLEKAKSLSANSAGAADLIFTQRGTLGQVSIVPGVGFDRYIVSQSQMKVSLDQTRFDPEFFYYYFSSPAGLRQVIDSAIQTGVPHTNLGILRRYRLPVPKTKREQAAIAEVLGDADGLIEALEALIAKKRAIKQGAMQDLLSGKNRGTTTRLGSVLKIGHGRSQKAVEISDGPYPILASGGQIGTASQFLYDRPSVLIGRKGTIDRPQYADTPFWTIDTLFYTVIAEPNVPKYLFYRFCMIDWRQYNEASGVPSLNSGTIENIEIELHRPDEQRAIATVLSDMDAEIAALEDKLAKARAVKQGMMQVLLTGEIRLI